jgi:hypothetical protein
MASPATPATTGAPARLAWCRGTGAGASYADGSTARHPDGGPPLSPLDRHPARAALRALAAAGLATGLALSAAPAAEARTAYHADRTHDVRRASALVVHPDVRPAPRRRDGDVRSIRLANGSYVGVRVRFADLVHTRGYRYDLLRVVTNEHRVRNISVVYGPGFGSGYVRVTRANRHSIRCRVTHSVDYRHNVVAIHVSRRCLSKPRWVRIGYAAQTVTPDLKQLFTDDALRVGTHTTAGPSTMSRRIWRH